MFRGIGSLFSSLGSGSATSGSTIIGPNTGVYMGGIPENLTIFRQDTGKGSAIVCLFFTGYLLWKCFTNKCVWVLLCILYRFSQAGAAGVCWVFERCVGTEIQWHQWCLGASGLGHIIRKSWDLWRMGGLPCVLWRWGVFSRTRYLLQCSLICHSILVNIGSFLTLVFFVLRISEN